MFELFFPQKYEQLKGSKITLPPDIIKKEEAVQKSLKTRDKYLAAAETGDPESQNSLGLLYRNGDQGYKTDAEKAAYWFNQAAKQGLPDAQYNFAIMYLDGLGVKQNKEHAIHWMEKAASQGYLIAVKTLDTILEK